MLPILRIRLKESRPVGIGRDLWRKCCKIAFERMGWFWFERMLPRHFKIGAAARYGYRPRSKKWIDRKQKLAQRGKALPNAPDIVLTGRTKESVTRSVVVKAFPTRVRITTFAPNYARINPRATSNRPNLIKEMTAITKSEIKELIAVFKRELIAQLKKARKPRTITI